VDIDAPAVAKKSLQRGGAEDQQRIPEQRATGVRGAKRRIDAAFDQPGEGDAGKVRADQRKNTQDEKAAMPVN
jgi:hypothetical protein